MKISQCIEAIGLFKHKQYLLGVLKTLEEEFKKTEPLKDQGWIPLKFLFPEKAHEKISGPPVLFDYLEFMPWIMSYLRHQVVAIDEKLKALGVEDAE